MVYFGKLKGTEDEWGFDNFESSFETFIETDEETNIKIIQQANEEQKIIKADKNGNPILVTRPQPTKQELNSIKIEELKNYLSDTDWYAIRFADTGEEIPVEIKKKRQEAREEIKRLSD